MNEIAEKIVGVFLLVGFTAGLVVLLVHTDREIRREHPQPYTQLETWHMWKDAQHFFR
jgi:hypothetical protein